MEDYYLAVKDWLTLHREWLFSGAGVAIVLSFLGFIANRRKKTASTKVENSAQNIQNIYASGEITVSQERTKETKKTSVITPSHEDRMRVDSTYRALNNRFEQERYSKNRYDLEKQRMSRKGGGGSAGCFPGTSLLMTEFGTKTVTSAQRGDSVLSFNDNTYSMMNATVYKCLSFGLRSTLMIVTSSGTLTTTFYHPLYTKVGWKIAGRLEKSDNVAIWDSVEQRLVFTRVIEVTDGKERETFKIVTTGPSTFVVDGFLVHSFSHFRSLRSLSVNLLSFINRGSTTSKTEQDTICNERFSVNKPPTPIRFRR